MSELHRRVSDAIRPMLADEVYQSARIADAVVAALGLRQIRNVVDFDEPRRRYVTPWERIEDDA